MRSVNDTAAERRGAFRGAAVLALSILVGAPASAAPEFIARFDGTWEGDGEVLRNEDGKRRGVSCRVENSRKDNTSLTDGECRSMIIFKRDIGSEITLQPDGSFTGIYRGADTGPARLQGSLDGDTLELDMTYAKPVYGDHKAVMKITNPANGSYTVSVYDHVNADGELEQVSHIDFRRVED